MSSHKDPEKREIRLEIDARVWRRLEEQVKFLRELKIPELASIGSAEDLVTFYVEQLAISDRQLSSDSRKVANALMGFDNRGVNMRQLLNSFTEKTPTAVEDDELEEEWEG